MMLDLSDESADDEHETQAASEPQWREFERSIAELSGKLDSNARVEHDVRTPGLISRNNRQIDVLITGHVTDQVIRIAVECKFYARRVGIGGVDEFIGKLLDLDVDRGVLYALNGFTSGAWSRAKPARHPPVVLRDLAGERPQLEAWRDGLPEFKEGECPNANCYFGSIAWNEWPQSDGSTVWAGICAMCGTWAVRCRECEELNGFFWDELRCYSCDESYELIYDREGVDVDNVLALGTVPET